MPFIPRNNPVHNIPTLRGGLNDRQESDEIKDWEMADCENFTIEEDSIKSAFGYVDYDNGSNAGPYYGIFQLKLSDGTQALLRHRGTVLEYDSDGTGTWVECTLPTTGSPATTISLAETLSTFAQLNDTILFADGTNILSSTDGINWTDRSATLPVCSVVFNNGANRIIFTKQASAPYRIDWSDINDPLTVDAASYQLIDPNSNGIIMGMGKTPDGTNLVFKEMGIYQISSYATDGLIDVNYLGSATCGSHQSIVTTEDSVIWIGQATVYEYINGIIRTIFGNIKQTGRNVVPTGTAVATYLNDIVYLSIPDADVSTLYNAQEYLFYKKLSTGDPKQPYPITRNRRYFGCYGIEDLDLGGGYRLISIYGGDSRLTATGSPAVPNDLFVFQNSFREEIYAGGLNGEAQSCFLVTKYFTDDIPFYVKRFKKIFTDFKVEDTTTITIGYRFLPYGTFNETTVTVTSDDLDFKEGFGFDEGFGFSLETIGQLFTDIENTEKPRGIQFKISSNQVNDVTLLGLAYQFRVKNKFK